MNPSFRLVMQTGPTPGREIPLQKSELIIGRDLNNDIVINDAEVSRRHARLFLQGTSYMLEDLGSTNGSFINGQRLAGPTSIRPGEIVTLGEIINLVFEALSFSQPPSTSIPAVPTVRPIAKPPEPASHASAPTAPPPPIISQPVRSENLTEPPKSSQFSGQVPGADPNQKSIAKTHIPTWVWIVIAIETVLLIFLIIDDARLWCPLFGWLLNSIFPGACPIP